jgi:NADH-quinone oxidoreductase subunit E
MDLPLDPDEKTALQQIKQQLSNWGTERSRLIPILQMIQEKMAFLPPRAIEIVAQHLDISASEVFGVATFYNQFRFTPPGKNPVKVCLGTACHVRGADIILENFERKLEIKDGETTADREFSIDRVACVGCCALAPVALIGETIHGKMAPSKVEGLIMRCGIEKEMAQRAAQKKETGE